QPRTIITQQQQKYLGSLLYEWFILDSLPLHALESLSSRRFISNLNPDFNIPSNKRFKNKLFESKSYVSQKVSEISRCETSQSKMGFFGVTAHFITSSFELKEIILAAKHLRYPHTGNNIQEALESIISEW
ncbi:10891_t:CDS:2, partial [Scutellospora calospora]